MEVKIEDFFDAPVIESVWKRRPNRSEDLIRFGLMWKAYDIVSEKKPDWCPPSLVSGLDGYHGYLLGGVSGSSFLVRPSGLTQPHAWKGIIEYKTLGASERRLDPDYVRVYRKR